MWTTINGFDRTGNVNLDIQADLSMSDPLAKLGFTFDDPGCLITLNEIDEVIVWDENFVDAFGVAQPPAMNYVVNVLLQNNGGGTTQVPNPYTSSGTNANLFLWNNNTFNVPMTFSNSPVANGLTSQQTIVNYVKPRQSYCFSCEVQGSGTLVAIQYILQLQFQDITGANVGSLTSTTGTPTPSLLRPSITAVAPAGAVYATFTFGGQATNATNSGTMTFIQPQFEPMWFVSKGISYPTSLNNFATVTSAELPDGTTSRLCRIFAGYIDDLQISYEGNNRTYTVSGAGPGSVLENQNLININYSTPTPDSTILTNIVTTYYAGILGYQNQHTQGVPTSIQTGVTVPSLSQSDATFRDILNGMTDLSGFIFFVDMYYYIHYQPVYWDTTTVVISDNPDYVTSYPPQDYMLEKDATQIKNRIKVTGAQLLSGAVTDLFSGNGSNKIFNLSFQPFNVQSVTVGGTSQRVGVNGRDTNGVGGIQALYDKGGQQLIFNSAPASGTNNVACTYTYQAPISISVQSLDSYAKYGKWFDSKVNDSSLTSVNAATTRGLAELTKYAFSRPIVTLNLNQFISPGTTVLLTSQHDGYSSAPFTVQTLSATTQGGGVNVYQYTCGSYNPTFIDHIRNLNKASNRSTTTANVNAAVQTDLVTSDTIFYTDSVSVTVQPGPPYVYNTAKYGISTYG